MTDRPYTDEDLRAVAARLHASAARDTDDRINSAVKRQWGEQLDEDQLDEAGDELVTLLDRTPNVSKWAVQLGAAGLAPHEPIAVHSTTGGWEAAVQVATATSLTDEARAELLAEVQEAVTATVCRVLGLKPVQ